MWSDSQRRTVLSICSSSRGLTLSIGRSSPFAVRHVVRLPAQDGPLCLQFVTWSDSQRRTVLSVCSSSCGPTPSAGRSSPFAELSSHGPTPSAGRSSPFAVRHVVRLPAQDGPLRLQFVTWSDSQRRTVLSVCSSSCGPTLSTGRSSPFAELSSHGPTPSAGRSSLFAVRHVVRLPA